MNDLGTMLSFLTEPFPFFLLTLFAAALLADDIFGPRSEVPCEVRQHPSGVRFCEAHGVPVTDMSGTDSTCRG